MGKGLADLATAFQQGAAKGPATVASAVDYVSDTLSSMYESLTSTFSGFTSTPTKQTEKPDLSIVDVNPVYKEHAAKFKDYYVAIYANLEKPFPASGDAEIDALLESKRVEALAKMNGTYVEAMKAFTNKNPSAQEVAFVKKSLDEVLFPKLEKMKTELEREVAGNSSPAPSSETETDIDPATGKKKDSGLNWSRIAGGGIFAILGYFLGQMFGAGPFGMIASLGLAVGGFFVGGGMGEKIFGGLGGSGKSSGDSASPAQGAQLAQSQQQGQAGQPLYTAPGPQVVAQPYGFPPNGLSPLQAQYMASQSGYVPPQASYPPQGGYAYQDVGQGYAPQAPIYYGAPPLGGINRVSVQGKDFGVNYNANGGFGARARF